MQHQQKIDPHFQRRADALAEAIEQQQIAARAASQWQEVLDKAGDKYTRRYLEGQVELSKHRASHHNLVAQSCHQAGHERAPSSFNLASEGKSKTMDHEPLIRAKSCLEIALARKGRDKALSERDIHHAKAAAFTMLGDRCRELGIESWAGTYEARAGRESAAARGFDSVIRADDRKLEDLGVRTILREESPDLHNCLRCLENAERYLEDYNNAHARAISLMRQTLEFEPAIQKLEVNSADQPLKQMEQKQFHELADYRDLVAALAEREAIAAVLSYKSFQQEIQSAQEKDVDTHLLVKF